MIRFRLPLVTFTAWLFVLCSALQLPDSIQLAPLTSMLAAVCGLAVLLIPPLVSFQALYLLSPAAVLFLVLKYSLGYSLGGAALPVTLIEYSAIAVTILLAQWVARGFEELRTAVFCNMVGDLVNRTQVFGSGQGELYREVRRARQFERPLAFLAITAAPGAIETAKDRFTAEVMKRMLGQYAAARIADLLSRRLKDCDVIARRNGHFVAALPETDRDAAIAVSRRLRKEARQELGIELTVGFCTCPDEEATFIGLLDRAEENMRRANDFAPTDELDSTDMEPDIAADDALNGSSIVKAENHTLLAPTDIAG
ncbi:MAG: hypothetical protein WD894_00820 [Pirellulales bacterium]